MDINASKNTKVYLVEEQSCISGDCMHNLIGIYSSLEKAQNVYENIKHKAEKKFNSNESWYKNESTQSTNIYYELMDNTIAPEKYYSLQLEEKPLQ